MIRKLKFYIFFLVTIITGCTSTPATDFNFPTPEKFSQKNGIDFNIFSKNSTSSSLTKYIPTGFSKLTLSVEITNIYPNKNHASYTKINLINQELEKTFSILFYYNKETKLISTLVKHSDDDFHESLGVNFSTQEKMQVIAYRENDKSIGISVEPYSKMNELLQSAPGETISQDFSFSIIEIGFNPDKVEISGASIDAKLEDIKF